MNPPTTPSQQRLTELDWLRILAFGLLILYHVGMYYVRWDWHVKTPHPVPALETWMSWLNPWRLPLLFLISGAALALLAGPQGQRRLAGPRSRRLLPPILFGMAVVVPPQAYLQAVEQWHYAGSYVDFQGLYFRAYHGFCREGRCLDLPTWNHLWFVVYLWLYTLLAALLWRCAGRWTQAPAWAQFTRGARLLWVPWLLLAVWRQQLLHHFPPSNDLVHDFYNHALYLSVFVLGAALFGQRDDRHGAWAAALRLRWWALGAAVAAQLFMMVMWPLLEGRQDVPESLNMALRTVNAMRQWAPLVAALGFARRHLAGREGPARRWLTQAVFPFYIAHQTIIVIAAPWLARQGLHQGLEAALLVALTALGCVLVFLVVRRVPILSTCMGVDRARAGSAIIRTS
jgi:glucans biosynthesis protein C